MQREQQTPGLPTWAQGDDASTALAPDLGFAQDVGPHDVSAALYTRQVIATGYARARSVTWPTSAAPAELAGQPEVTYHAAFVASAEALLEGDGWTARINVGNGRVTLWVAARTDDHVGDVVADFQERFPRAVPDEAEPKASVTFWSLGEHGPTGRTREIAVSPWAEIGDHYVDMTRSKLDGILGDEFEPGRGGQLHLWNGPPGTGKTYALRALAWEWRTWCDLHYVTDPETFFGEKAGYMLDVLLSGDGDEPAIYSDDEDDADAKPKVDPRAEAGRWRLLVLEDTGELMSADARDRSGQGLSRLLNVVDGLIGQGLRILVLVTTNEEVRKLHAAVSRAGRCASHIEFAAFPTSEANDWLLARGAEAQYGGAMTIADLFAIAEERALSESAQPVGFNA